MKNLAVAILLVVTLAFAGCGSNSKDHGNINGNWTALLTDANGSLVFKFATSLIVNGDGTLSINNFSFSTNSP